MKEVAMKQFYTLLVILLTLVNFNNLYSQCSDAGICQLGSHFDELEKEKLFDVSLSYYLSASKKLEDVTFHAVKLNASYEIFENSVVNLQVPYNSQSGPLGVVSGIGDVIVSWTQTVYAENSSTLQFSLGGKFATGDDNAEMLPQIYQSGLGSNDLLLGANYSIDSFNFGVGYQIAGARNDNSFTRLKRGDDLLLRASYSIAFDKINITPKLLLIKRLGKSSVIDLTSPTEKFVEVPDSDQTQLNFLTQIRYIINDNYSLTGEAAVPFLSRDVNVDGLTRAFSIAVGINYSF